MTIPSFINEKTIRQGGLTLVCIFLLWIFSNALWDISGDIQAQAETLDTIQAQHQSMMKDSEELKSDLIREARKQTIMQQKNCIRLSTTKQEANDCLLFEP